MKTVKELQKELSDVTHTLETESLKSAAEKRLRKKIPFLKHCIMYLESNPDHNFLRSEITKVEEKINLRMLDFPLDKYTKQDPPLTKPQISKLKKTHEKEFKIPHLRLQVRTLRFLLKS